MEYAASIIIGGTKSTIGIIEDNGKIVTQTTFRTEKDLKFDLVMNRFINTILSLASAKTISQERIKGIGIGCTGPINRELGTITNNLKLPMWSGQNLKTPLELYFGIPTIIENNVDTAAYGEYFLNLDKQKKSTSILLTLGTGVGSGIIINGQILRVGNGAHPELGHIIVRDSGLKCSLCNSEGCLEMSCSGTAIALLGKNIGLKSSEEVFKLAKEGHPKAKQLIEEVKTNLLKGVLSIAHIFQPNLIVLGGGIMEEHFQLFFQELTYGLKNSKIPGTNSILLKKGLPGNDAGIIGAGILALINANSLE